MSKSKRRFDELSKQRKEAVTSHHYQERMRKAIRKEEQKKRIKQYGERNHILTNTRNWSAGTGGGPE